MVGRAVADLEIDSLSGPRFELALSLFGEGRAFFFDGVAFSLRDGFVECAVPSTWDLLRTTPESAAQDLDRARQVLAHIESHSAAFSEAVCNFPKVLVLIHDYGNGSLEICRQQGDGVLVWNRR